MDKAVLLGPAAIAQAAAYRARRPQVRWLLRQPRTVRASYVRTVLDAADKPNAGEIWMLRHPKPVRESYIREVLRGRGSNRGAHEPPCRALPEPTRGTRWVHQRDHGTT